MYRVWSLHLRYNSEDGGELVGELVGDFIKELFERNGFLRFNGEDDDDIELVGEQVKNFILNQR